MRLVLSATAVGFAFVSAATLVGVAACGEGASPLAEHHAVANACTSFQGASYPSGWPVSDVGCHALVADGSNLRPAFVGESPLAPSYDVGVRCVGVDAWSACDPTPDSCLDGDDVVEAGGCGPSGRRCVGTGASARLSESIDCTPCAVNGAWGATRYADGDCVPAGPGGDGHVCVHGEPKGGACTVSCAMGNATYAYGECAPPVAGDNNGAVCTGSTRDAFTCANNHVGPCVFGPTTYPDGTCVVRPGGFGGLVCVNGFLDATRPCTTPDAWPGTP